MPVDPVAVGAFLSGAAAVISATVTLRHVRKDDREECEKRMEALREGYKMGKEK